jgi:hypothetical protein
MLTQILQAHLTNTVTHEMGMLYKRMNKITLFTLFNYKLWVRGNNDTRNV